VDLLGLRDHLFCVLLFCPEMVWEVGIGGRNEVGDLTWRYGDRCNGMMWCIMGIAFNLL